MQKNSHRSIYMYLALIHHSQMLNVASYCRHLINKEHYKIRHTFSSADQVFHISGSKCGLCVCVWKCFWVLTRVEQIVTNAHRDL